MIRKKQHQVRSVILHHSYVERIDTFQARRRRLHHGKMISVTSAGHPTFILPNNIALVMLWRAAELRHSLMAVGNAICGRV